MMKANDRLALMAQALGKTIETLAEVEAHAEVLEDHRLQDKVRSCRYEIVRIQAAVRDARLLLDIAEVREEAKS